MEDDGCGVINDKIMGCTYPVVVLDCLRDNGIDEQGELLLRGCHFGLSPSAFLEVDLKRVCKLFVLGSTCCAGLLVRCEGLRPVIAD